MARKFITLPCPTATVSLIVLSAREIQSGIRITSRQVKLLQGGTAMTDLTIYIVLGAVIPALLVIGIALRETIMEHFRHHHGGRHAV